MLVTHERVLDAVAALVAAALPYAKTARNIDQPTRIPPGGAVVVRDGDPGEPDVTLSPLTYTYRRRIPLEVAGFESDSLTPDQVLASLMAPIGAAVQADRTLGGLCAWIEAEAPITNDLDATGGPNARWADAAIIAEYDTADPLS